MRIRKVDATIDLQIITGMIVSTEFLRNIKPIYKPDYLKTSFAVTVAYWCLEYFRRYDKAPGKDIQNIFYAKQRQGLDDTQAEQIEQFLTNLSKEHEKQELFNVEYLLNEAEKLFRKRALENLSEDIDAHLSQGQLEDAEKCLTDFKLEPRGGSLLSKIEAITKEPFLQKEFRRPMSIVDPIFREGSLNLIYSDAGVGKTWLSLALAVSLTRKSYKGIEIGSWTIKRPIGVLILDGEMLNYDLQERLNSLIINKGEGSPEYPLVVLTSEELPELNLTLPECREVIIGFLERRPEIRVVFVDNLNCLVPGIDENAVKDWAPLNQWLVQLKHMGCCVIALHHENKAGDQSGTSARLRNLDTVIRLASKGTDADFEITFRKARHLRNHECKRFRLRLFESASGGMDWMEVDCSQNGDKDERDAEVVKLHRQGVLQTEIAKKIGLTPARVNQIIGKMGDVRC